MEPNPNVVVAVAVVVVLLVLTAFAIVRAAVGQQGRVVDEASGTGHRLIDTAEAADRLARAIASDIALYNAELCKDARRGLQGPDFDAVVDEGRSLFASRVTPSLHRLYDTAIDAVILRPRADS